MIGRWAGGGALIGSRPALVAPPEVDPFSLFDLVPELESTTETAGRPPVAVGGGWFGYLGYGLGSRIEKLDPPPPPGGSALPPFSLAYYDHLLHLDRGGKWWFEALVTPPRAAEIEARLAHFRRLIASGGSNEDRGRHTTWEGQRGFRTEPWQATPRAAGHGRAVAACRERIHAGDLFQANICQRLSSRLSGDPLDLFIAGAQRLRPDRAAYLGGPWGALASFSPELFLERHGRRVRTAPIKGTRPRPAGDTAAAEAHRADLAASSKDRAENQMIVDMARNDLGRVCLYGTVTVETSAEVRAHTGVWHLISEITGELHPQLGDQALLRATFPPASVTGAPKIAAENVIAELESSRREIYTGVIGFASPLAGLELSVAIRSFEFGPASPSGGKRESWLGVGGGIVAESDPRAEIEECQTKALPLLKAIGAELAADATGNLDVVTGNPGLATSPPLPRRLGPKPLSRPDPAAGIFETIRIENQQPLDLDRHLARLAASAAALYGQELPANLVAEVGRAATSVPQPSARLRIDLGSAGETRILTSDLPQRRSSSLVPVCLPGGLGSHKWADRRLLNHLAEAVAPHIPLLCDLDGQVFEAAHASVFADLGEGLLVTPPLDGRILPGIARARVLAGEFALPGGVTVATEAILTLADLDRARAVYVVNALTRSLREVRVIPAPSEVFRQK